MTERQLKVSRETFASLDGSPSAGVGPRLARGEGTLHLD